VRRAIDTPAPSPTARALPGVVLRGSLATGEELLQAREGSLVEVHLQRVATSTGAERSSVDITSSPQKHSKPRLSSAPTKTGHAELALTGRQPVAEGVIVERADRLRATVALSLSTLHEPQSDWLPASISHAHGSRDARTGSGIRHRGPHPPIEERDSHRCGPLFQ